ncbi:MAG: hypothetical protein IM591_09030 [Chitinophagaceae bacterium]|nr:hypothetical protein [Chitinophagaceae bacterium]
MRYSQNNEQDVIEQYFNVPGTFLDIGAIQDSAIKILEQAKQMEREQHKDTWDAGMSEGIGTTMGSLDYDGEFINYYNETYIDATRSPTK